MDGMYIGQAFSIMLIVSLVVDWIDSSVLTCFPALPRYLDYYINEVI